jgi:Recombinase
MIKRDEYAGQFRAMKPRVLDRDGHKCVKCGHEENSEVHHIEGYKCNELDMLATLCFLCHCVAPMGKNKFDLWLYEGKSGAQELRGGFVREGIINIGEDEIIKICEVVCKFQRYSISRKMRLGRELKKEREGKCSGRKHYGDSSQESEVLSQMIKMRESGESYDRIAIRLNEEKMLSRYGKQWRATTIARIIKREKNKLT